MGVYNNNKDGTRSTLANTIQVVDAPMEQFLSRGEFSAVTPNDVSADNKLVAENEVTKAVDTMPTASVDLVGTIVQYIGTTTANYTNGYFYKCISDGAVTPTYSWVEVISSFVTPEQFGAVGDGVTDDSQAIDNALTVAVNKKIPINFAHKTYLVNSFRFPNNIIMLGDNTTLLGGLSLANIENNNRHDIYVKGITFDFSKRIKLQGNASTQYANITFEDCIFKGAEQTALHLQWVSDIILRNCKFDNCGAELTDPNTYGRAINIVGQTNDSDTVFMKNIIIDGCEFSRTYGNKSISINNGWISGIDIRNCYFHDTTYGGIEFYNWRTKTNGYINVVRNCIFERMGAAPMAEGDPHNGTSSSGVGCCALYLKNSSSAVIATRNIFKYCVENAIEGPWQEISYNIIDTTGIMQDTRPTPSIEGIYLNGTQQSVHHNDIKRTGRTAIIATNQSAPGITDLKIFSNIIKDSNQYEGWTDTDDIRCTMFAKGLTLRDNSYDNNFFLNLNSSNGAMENFYWNQPRLFVSSQALHFKNGIVDIDGETSRKDGWELSSAVTRNDEGHYLLPQNAQMAYKFEFNRFDGTRAHLIAKVKYSMQNIVGTDNVLRISIDTDTSHPNSSVLYIKGKYASASSEASITPDEVIYNVITNPTGNPSEQGWYENTGTSQTPIYTLTSDTTVVSGKTYYQKKEYYTDYAILNTDNTSSKILTAQIKNVSANAGNLEIVDVDFKVPYGIAIDDFDGKILHYNIMPSTAELLALPNNMVFETDGFWAQKDGHGGKYLISAYQQGGCLTVTDGTTTKYLFALDNNGNMSKNYVDPTRFGVRAIDNINGTLTLENTYAEANSQIMSSIVAANMNATIRFPKGIFVFASPLDLSNRQYSLVGDDAPIPRTSALGYTGYDVGTLLCFPFLTNGQVAITMSVGNVENIAIYGNKDTYNITFDRTKAISGEVITETIAEDNGTQIKCTGLTKSSIGFIKNVYVFCFYKGMHLESNIYASNIYCRKCHTGIEALNDTKFVGVYGYDIYQLMYVNSILTSIVQLRVDSCFNALYLSRADKCTFIDIDGDWCTDSLIKAINVNYCVFEGIHGRCCTLKSYDSELMPNGYDVRTINDTNGYGIIRAVKLKNSRIVFNNGISRCFDSAQQGDLKYYIPNVVFTFPKGDNNVEVTDNQFVFNNTITSSDDILKVIQTKADVTIRIDTSSGTYYIEGTTAQEDNPSTNIDFSTLLGGE